MSKRKKHDNDLGRVKYSASRREDVVIMSFPIYKNAIAIIAEPNINIDRFAWKIIEILRAVVRICWKMNILLHILIFRKIELML